MLARKGLSLLAKVEESPERQRRELALQTVLGSTLAATQGYAAPDVLVAMARARVLAEELGEQPELGPIIWGLFAYYLVSGDIPEARTVADQYLRVANASGDPTLLIGAHIANGISAMYVGDMPAAVAHCDKASEYYDRSNRAVYHSLYRMDPGVFLNSERARSLWIIGKPDTALSARDAALDLGADNPDPRSLAFAHLFASVLHQLRREVDKCLEHSATCIAICDEHGIAQERVWAMANHGWAVAHSGKPDEGIKEIEASIAIQRSRHAELNLTFALRQLAECLNLKGAYIAGRDAAREGLKISERHGEVASKIELYRIMGESARMLAKSGEIEAATHTRSGSTLSAEACFRAAVDLARKQQAKGFELRSTVAYARELADRGELGEARRLVTAIRQQFTEGQELRDLRDADDLLRLTE